LPQAAQAGARGLDQQVEYFFVPGLRREFSAAEIVALMAPRRHLSLVGRDDPLTRVAGVASSDRALQGAYAALGRPDAWRQHVFADTGHQETAAMGALVLAALSAVLLCA